MNILARHLGGVLLLANLTLAAASDLQPTEAPEPEVVLQVGHRKMITSAAYSRDGRHLLTGSLDGTAILWDAATGLQLRSFRNDSVLFGIAFSPDGRQLATCGKDQIVLWATGTGERVKTFNPKFVRGRLAYSPDGKRLLVEVPRLGHYGIAQAILFDTETGQFHTLAHGKPGQETRDSIAACFSPNGKYILTGSDDKVAILWDAGTREKLRSFEGHGGAVTAVAFSPDSAHVLTGSADGKVILWDTVTGRKARTLEGHASAVTSVAFAPDGGQLASGDKDGTAILWDAAKGSKVRNWKTAAGTSLQLDFRPRGGQLLATAGRRLDPFHWRLDVWDTKTGTTAYSRQGPRELVRSVAVSADGRYVLTGGVAGRVGLWDTEEGGKWRSLIGHDEEIQGIAKILFVEIASSTVNEVLQVAFSPDGRTAVSADLNGVAIVWDLRTGKKIHACAHGFYIAALAFGSDGKRFYAATATVGKGRGGTGEPGVLVAWDAVTGKSLLTFEKSKGHAVGCLAVSGDGSQLLAGCLDGAVVVWDASNGKRLHTFKAHSGRVVGLIFAADGKRFVTASEDKTATVWDAKTRRKLRTIEGFQDPPAAMALSPGGGRLVVGTSSPREAATVWSLSTGKKRRSFQGDVDGIDGLAFHPNGRLMITTSTDGLVRVWDATNGAELARLVGLESEADWIVVAPNGQFDASLAARARVTFREAEGPGVHARQGLLRPGLLREVWAPRKRSD